MADVQLDQVRHVMQQRQVLVIQAVPGVDLQAERVRLLRAGDQPFQLVVALRLLVERLGESAGVQLNELAARARRGLDLRRIGRDEQADLDPAVVHPLARLGQSPAGSRPHPARPRW